MPATTIDELIVTLALDPSKFNKGQREALDSFRKLHEQAGKHAQGIEEGVRRSLASFEKLGTKVLGVYSAFIGGRGLVEFARYMSDTTAATGRLAYQLGLLPSTLSQFNTIAKLTGGSAAGMSGTLLGLTRELQNFQLTGKSDLIPLFNQMGIGLVDVNGKFKTSTQLLAEMNHWAQGVDPGTAGTLFARMGIDESTINLLLMTEAAFKALTERAKQLGVVTKEDEEAGKALQASWGATETAAEFLGLSIQTKLTPALTVILDSLTKFFNFMRGDLASSYGKKMLEAATALVTGPFAPYVIPKLFGEGGPLGTPAPAGGTTAGTTGGPMTPAEQEAYIRAAAAQRGIDPDVAVRVAKSEGLNEYVGDRGSSFGPYQLHYGHVASGGMAVAGLGDEFTRKTGLDARDPTTTKQQIDFALDEAKKSGWGAWHGWHGTPFAGITGSGVAAATSNSNSVSSSSSSQTTIGTVVINSQATDANGIATDIRAVTERNTFNANANSW